MVDLTGLVFNEARYDNLITSRYACDRKKSTGGGDSNKGNTNSSQYTYTYIKDGINQTGLGISDISKLMGVNSSTMTARVIKAPKHVYIDGDITISRQRIPKPVLTFWNGSLEHNGIQLQDARKLIGSEYQINSKKVIQYVNGWMISFTDTITKENLHLHVKHWVYDTENEEYIFGYLSDLSKLQGRINYSKLVSRLGYSKTPIEIDGLQFYSQKMFKE